MSQPKIAWIVNKDESLTKAEIMESHEYKVLGKKGYMLKLLPEGSHTPVSINSMLPEGDIFPPVYVQDERPNLWFYKGRSLPIRDLDNETFVEDPVQNAMLRERAKSLVPKEEPYEFLPHTADFIDGITSGKPVFIVGPKGTGKSSLIEQVCARTNWPFIRFNVTQLVVQDLVGTVLVQGGETVWIDGLLTLAVRLGAMTNADEFDFIEPDISSFFFPVLEQPPKFTLKEKPDCEVMKFNPLWRIVGTGNVMGADDVEGYHGTQSMNAALKSRWSAGKIITALQMTTQQEREVVGKRIPWAPGNIIKRCSNIAAKIRESAYSELDTRQIMAWVENVVLKRNYLEAAELTWLPVIASKAQRENAADIIRKNAKFVIIGKSAMESKEFSVGGKRGAPLSAITDLPPHMDMLGMSQAQITDPDWLKAVYEAKEKYGLAFSAIEEHFNIKRRNGNNAHNLWKKYKNIIKVCA